jgi:hypothetical protein
MLKPETRCHAEKHACIEGTAQVSKVIPMLRPNVDFDLEGLDLLLADGPEDLLNIIISNMEVFLNQVVLRNWKDSIKAFQSCEVVLPHAEALQIVRRCVDSLAVKACTDPKLFGWPMMEHGAMQSPGGSVLWNGIGTGARPKNASSDWWYEDVTVLSLQLYKRLMSAMETRGIKPEYIAGSLTLYAKRYLPGINRRQGTPENSSRFLSLSLASAPSEDDQRLLLEAFESLLPMLKGVASTRFLFGLLRTAMILNASPDCKSNLERCRFFIILYMEWQVLEMLTMENF